MERIKTPSPGNTRSAGVRVQINKEASDAVRKFDKNYMLLFNGFDFISVRLIVLALGAAMPSRRQS